MNAMKDSLVNKIHEYYLYNIMDSPVLDNIFFNYKSHHGGNQRHIDMKYYIFSLILLPCVSMADNQSCDIYYNNVNEYFEIMSLYDNDKTQIQDLRVKFSDSRKSVTEAKDISKNDICKHMNEGVVKLINKYMKKTTPENHK